MGKRKGGLQSFRHDKSLILFINHHYKCVERKRKTEIETYREGDKKKRRKEDKIR